MITIKTNMEMKELLECLNEREMALLGKGNLVVGHPPPPTTSLPFGRRVFDGIWVYDWADLSLLPEPDEMMPGDCGVCYECVRLRWECLDPTEDNEEYENWWKSFSFL